MKPFTDCSTLIILVVSVLSILIDQFLKGRLMLKFAIKSRRKIFNKSAVVAIEYANNIHEHMHSLQSDTIRRVLYGAKALSLQGASEYDTEISAPSAMSSVTDGRAERGSAPPM